MEENSLDSKEEGPLVNSSSQLLQISVTGCLVSFYREEWTRLAPSTSHGPE